MSLSNYCINKMYVLQLHRYTAARQSACLTNHCLGPHLCQTPLESRNCRRKLLKRTKVCHLKQQKKSCKQATKRDTNIKSIISQLSVYLPSDTILFTETQIRMSQRKKQGHRWAIKDKMLALFIFYHSRKAYRLLSKLFCLPSKLTLLRSLRKSNLSPGFSDQVFNALKLKVARMPLHARQCAMTFDEMSLISALVYNYQLDTIEGFENFGDMGQSKYMATHALAWRHLRK